MTWKRIATAAVLIPVVVAVVWWGPTGLVAVLAALVAGLALVEFFALAERVGLHAYRLWTLVCFRNHLLRAMGRRAGPLLDAHAATCDWFGSPLPWPRRWKLVLAAFSSSVWP